MVTVIANRYKQPSKKGGHKRQRGSVADWAGAFGRSNPLNVTVIVPVSEDVVLAGSHTDINTNHRDNGRTSEEGFGADIVLTSSAAGGNTTTRVTRTNRDSVTVANNTKDIEYQVSDWGLAPDLHALLAAQHPELGDSRTFQLIDWHGGIVDPSFDSESRCGALSFGYDCSVVASVSQG
jgi:hypothetical protein